jgi:hypothetical protein
MGAEIGRLEPDPLGVGFDDLADALIGSGLSAKVGGAGVFGQVAVLVCLFPIPFRLAHFVLHCPTPIKS